MTFDYECDGGHITERFCVPVKEVEEGQAFICPQCFGPAFPRVTLNQGFALYGNPAGYHKPSATRRHSNKLINKHGKNS